jgi:hypothetical protein
MTSYESLKNMHMDQLLTFLPSSRSASNQAGNRRAYSFVALPDWGVRVPQGTATRRASPLAG